jgi:predicted DNA-binding transcriptional regulator AlpA
MEQFLTERQVAGVLGVSPQLLRKWRASGQRDLPHVKIGRCVRYDPRDVEAFIERRKAEANDSTEPPWGE